jgi:uncharacterized protein
VIQNSFIFLEKVKKGVEKRLYEQGICNWDSFLNAAKITGLSATRKYYYDRKILEARKELYSFNSSYFKKLLPQSEYYRLYDFFKEDAVFLDIETTGLDFRNDDITMVGLFDGLNTKTMIRGINLDYKRLKDELEKYKIMVTFNGARFDIPFINKTYPDLLPDIPNFDIRSVTDKLNLKGGLKKIEKDLGISRSRIIEKFSGGDALTLWRMYRATGDDYYLNLLVEYNEEDIVNLKKIAEHCIGILKEKYIKTQ